MASTGIRSGPTRALAGHGFADAKFRPPRLPYLSIVGPTGVMLEPERDSTRPEQLFLQHPGYLRTGPWPATGVVPDGSLTLVFDGEARVAVGGLAGGDLADAGFGPRLADDLEQAIRSAVPTDPAGLPIGDASVLSDLQARLRRVTCRFDGSSRTLAVASGRRGMAPEPLRGEAPGPSSVTVPDPIGPLGEAIRADAAGASAPGPLVRHRIEAPRALAVDVRVDLWAGSQGSLGELVDRWLAGVPVRGTFVTRPALLAADVEPGVRQVRLLPTGEALLPGSLLQLEPAGDVSTQVAGQPDGGYRDRRSDTALSATGAVSFVDGAAGRRYRLGGDGRLAATLLPTAQVPNPLLEGQPAARGLAVSLGFQAVTSPANGSARLLTLSRVLTPGAAAIELLTVAVTFDGVPPEQTVTFTATLPDPGGTAASHALTVPDRYVRTPVNVHLLVDDAAGAVQLWLDTDGQALLPPVLTETPPLAVAGLASRLGSDMTLTLGAGAASNPFDVDLAWCHVLGERLGPADPGLRARLTPATGYSLGDRLVLTDSPDGHSPSGARFAAVVTGIEGDRVLLDRPVDGRWPRGRTLVFERELFLHQTQIRRRDDLLNRLYRLCADYRISTVLPAGRDLSTAEVVRTPVVDVRTTTVGRPLAEAPGITVTIQNNPSSQ